MDAVPVSIVAEMLRQADLQAAGRLAQKPYVSEMQPGAVMFIYDGPGGERVGTIDFETRRIHWHGSAAMRRQ